MALFPQDALNPGVRKREVFGWAMYDFANSGYTTVVHHGGVRRLLRRRHRGQGALGHVRLDGGAQRLLRDRDAHHAEPSAPGPTCARAKKRLLVLVTAGCVLGTAALALAGPGSGGAGDGAGHRLQHLLLATASR